MRTTYTGVMSFKYKTPDMPSDALFTEQWYLNDINVLPVWRDAYGQGYTGKNIKIAQFEPGMPFTTEEAVFDYRHADLQANADRNWLADPNAAITQDFSQHATLVAGVMVAARNGEGAVGVAYDAKLSGHFIQGTGLEVAALTQEITQALAQFKHYDVVNNSWGSTANFNINVVPVGTLEQGIQNAVGQGRNGLGTIIVMAGGNERQNGGNTNTNALTANRAVITTGAINAQGDISTLSVTQAPFSNPGASILVSAPGSNVASTSRILQTDDGTIFGNDTATTQGTSFATPIVSGVVALMLEANPKLGWRDVQQILALTARKVNDSATDTVWNGANHWNGGGMHTSHDYGFGEVDARAAVRLAETWTGTHTSANERRLGNGEGSMNGQGNLNVALNDGAAVTRSISLGAGVRVEHATVSLDLTHSNWGDLIVELISPTGTVSRLIAHPGSSAANPGGDVGTGRLNFALDTTHDFGENAQGTGQLRITDRSGRGTGTLNGWKVEVYGSDWSETQTGLTVAGQTPVNSVNADNVYFYTDEFAGAPGSNRQTLTDSNGGKDIINASAVSSGSTINLNNGSTSTIAGRSLTINGGVEFAFGGDGNDTLIGNAQSNRLQGGRGNDSLNGGDGLDWLDGGAGNDTLTGGTGSDLFILRKQAGGVESVTDFSPTVAGEKLILVGFDNITDFAQVTVTQEGVNTRLTLGGGQSVLLLNRAPSQISEQNFTFVSDDAMLEQYASYAANPSTWTGTAAVENTLLPNTYGDLRAFALGGNDVLGGRTVNDLIDGGDGNDTLWGDYPGYAPQPGADWLEGGAGTDVMYGGGGNDLMLGGSGGDILNGEDGNDVLRGGSGTDVLQGGNGNDVLVGDAGNDHLVGGAGNDVLFMEGDLGTVYGTNYAYYGTRVGGDGADTFVVTATGGGNGGLIASGTTISAYNMIADFNPTQAGEVIDLTALTWIRGFSDLSLQNMTINKAAFTRVSATDGANQLMLNLRGVSASQLSAAHFKIAPTPGLVLGGTGNDSLTGDAGANIMDGKTGADAMTGRTGDDAYMVDNAGDTVIELPDGGFDTIRSSVTFVLRDNVENLALTGTAAINGTGNTQANRLTGNAGNNILDGGAGSDTLLGGAGNDTYVVDVQSDGIVELAGEGTDTVQASVSYTLGDYLENLTLTGTGNINATGNSLANILVGNAADNILDGAQGADTMQGGAGDDTYLVDNAGDVVTELADGGIDTVYASVNYTLGANVENGVLAWGAANGTGNALDNQITGNSINNVLAGGAGNDFLDGGTGADTLIGGAGNDVYGVDNAGDRITENTGEGRDTVYSSITLDLAGQPNLEQIVLTGVANLNATGNAADNTLYGNAGANVLAGGAGNDTLSGGGGADTFAFGTALNATGNLDTITDFTSGSDSIRLAQGLFSGLGFSGMPASSAFFRVGTGAQDADDRIVYNQGTGALYYDADGVGSLAAIQFAVLNSSPSLMYSDIHII
ncbi:MAG: S8 family serine peptidase [Pseudomonadota bacterium]|nr:S8 family serine peptidase [Pseudomonadota bacterium]